jgi:ankyrin repeat protein
MLDEFVHHGAEVSLLRDLWRWQHPLDADPLTERAMRGDPSLVDEIGDVDPATASELMRTAAVYARWEVVAALVEAGVAIPSEGRTPLHCASGAGEVDLVERLVGAGADPTAHDPEFDAPPIEWARFLGQRHVVEWFEQRAQN